MHNKDTIISPITATNGGSVCLIRISGKDAIKISDNFFPGTDLENREGGTFFFGKFIDASNQIIDEVIIYIFKVPKSYTGENVIEISCHNNVFIVDEILQSYLDRGCRIAKPGEFTQRAFLNGKMDLTQAEAVADLISAKSKAGVKNSLNVLEGKLSEKISKFKQSIIDLISLLELGLDFTEEGLELVSNEQFCTILEAVVSEIEFLLKSFSSTRQFQKGIEVLISGKPNVGKSSLMNSLLEKDRVIVSKTPGTTRDLIHEDIIIDDTLVRLIDTAGIRFTEDDIEAAGVEKAKKILETADVVLAVLDLSVEIDKDDSEIINHLVKNKKDNLILVGNKSDKKTLLETEKYLKAFPSEKVIISAKEGYKIDELRNTISRHIKKEKQFDNEDVLLTNKRHYEILTNVKNQLSKTLEEFGNSPGHEFVAMDLREATNTLSEITGEITTDDILNNIFSNFCIGK